MKTFDMTPLLRTTIGFDHLARMLASDHRVNTRDPGYPPYDILSDGDDKYRINMALAGFSESDLTIEVVEHRLKITGAKNDTSEGEYLHKGIATRDFNVEFNLADHVEVAGANFSSGILTIDLERRVPEALKPRSVEIKTSKPAGLIDKAKELLTDSSKHKSAA